MITNHLYCWNIALIMQTSPNWGSRRFVSHWLESGHGGLLHLTAKSMFFFSRCTMWLLMWLCVSDFSGTCQIYIKYLLIYYEERTHFGKLGMQAEKIRLPDNSNQAAYLRVAKMVWELCEQRQRCDCTTAVVQGDWWAEAIHRLSHEHPESNGDESLSSKNALGGVAGNKGLWKW